MPALFASDAQKAMNRNATTKVGLELVKHEGGQLAAIGFQIGQEGRPVFLDCSVKQSRFGTMAHIRARTDGHLGVTAGCWLRGRHQQELSAMRRYLLLAKRSFRHSRQEERELMAFASHRLEQGTSTCRGLRRRRGQSPGHPRHAHLLHRRQGVHRNLCPGCSAACRAPQPVSTAARSRRSYSFATIFSSSVANSARSASRPAC